MCDKRMKCGLEECTFNEERTCSYGTTLLYEAPCWRSEPVYDDDGNIAYWVEDKTLDDE